MRLRHSFHRLLSIVLDYMKALPPHHPVQHAALRCWAVNFEEADHAFLHQKHVFSEISQLLSHSESGSGSARPAAAKDESSATVITSEEDVTDKVTVKVSSREAMIASLTDGSTETFWESGDDEANVPKFVSFEMPKDMLAGTRFAFSLHIDNSRDSSNQVKKMTLKSGLSRKEAAVLGELSIPKDGAWYTLVADRSDLGAVVGVEISGPAANVRVRQVAVFQLGLDAQISVADDVHTDLCRADALFVFQHLSKQIMEAALEDEAGKEGDGSDSVARTASGSHDLKQHVVSLLGAGDRFSAMQRNLTRHLIKELHTEAVSYKDAETMTAGGDEYAFQLLSMVQGLIGSAAGGKFIGQSPGVIFDLALHLVKGTPRVQRQVLSVLTKLIPLVDGGTAALGNGDGIGIVPTLLLTLASALSLQVRCKGQDSGASNLTARDACRKAAADITSLFNGAISTEVAGGIVSLFKDVLSSKGADMPHAMRIRSGIMEHVDFFKRKELALLGPEEMVEKPEFWCAMASLCVLNEDLANEINQNEGPRDTAIVCTNHDDGVTPGEWKCAECDMLLCTECDLVLHLGKSTCNHKRDQLELAEPDLQVDFFEDTGRVRLKNIVTNVNGRTLKCLVEFKRTRTAGIVCRFCGDDLTEEGPLTNLSKCGLPNVCKMCVEAAKATCTKVLPCGHTCQGLRNEVQCLVCLVPNCASRFGLNIHQDAEDECFCYCGNLVEQACVRLHCGHIMHHGCIEKVLSTKWSGPRINFDFARCPVCRTDLLDNEQHPALQDLLEPVRTLHKSVKEKSLMRLEYDGAADMSISEADRSKLAMKKYACVYPRLPSTCLCP
jgi:E3 ubiquitin-protein ligase MYCBP2